MGQRRGRSRTCRGSAGAVAIALAVALLSAPDGGAVAQDGGPAGVQPQAFFKGKVLSMKGRRIELSYDFQDPAQIADWTHTHPFLTPPTTGGWRVEGGALRGEGSCAARHRAVFDGDVAVEATISSEKARDFGAVVISEEGTTFTLFSLNDAYFSFKDGRLPNEHMVTTFLPAGTGPGGTTFWRYVQTVYEPRVGADPVKISLRKKGANNEFRFAGTGRLGGDDVEARVGPAFFPAFYVIESRAVVKDVKVSGILSTAWLRQNGIAFEDTVPEGPKPGDPPPAAGGPPSRVEDAPWRALAAVVANGSLSREEREKAAKDLIATKEKRAVRAMIDILYNEADEDGREIAYGVFKGISGKDAGYRPTGDAEARQKSMENVWKVWLALRTAAEREEAKQGK